MSFWHVKYECFEVDEAAKLLPPLHTHTHMQTYSAISHTSPVHHKHPVEADIFTPTFRYRNWGFTTNKQIENYSVAGPLLVPRLTDIVT